MGSTRSEQIRAAIIALANAVLPFLVLVGAITWSAETISAFMLVVTTTITLFFLLLPNAKTDA